MNDDISRRDWVALTACAGAALPVSAGAEGTEAVQQTAVEESCPYFDQPLYCKGAKYCQ